MFVFDDRSSVFGLHFLIFNFSCPKVRFLILDISSSLFTKSQLKFQLPTYRTFVISEKSNLMDSWLEICLKTRVWTWRFGDLLEMSAEKRDTPRMSSSRDHPDHTFSRYLVYYISSFRCDFVCAQSVTTQRIIKSCFVIHSRKKNLIGKKQNSISLRFLENNTQTPLSSFLPPSTYFRLS